MMTRAPEKQNVNANSELPEWLRWLKEQFLESAEKVKR